MLWQRVVTALVLLLVLLPALFYPSAAPFAALAIVFIGAGAWEWARLVGYGASSSLACGLACALACVLAWAGGLLEQALTWLWLLATLVWVLGGAWLLRGGVPAWSALPRALRMAIGFLILLCAWLAVAQARTVSINFLLSILALVWAADIFAYFAGRAWGTRLVKRKLAPGISPGKSWEGVWGGIVGVMLLAVAWQRADESFQVLAPSLFSHLFGAYGWTALLALAGLAGISVVGDLIESLLKRSAGAKDSSALLPGHGGVLDRIDALLPTLPIAMLFYSL